ncbi:MAG: hypothetical protein GSR72_06960 [Desulfurococcales archaeon]|nr:hypothetical protein [Desulfurococcales archaeon]
MAQSQAEPVEEIDTEIEVTEFKVSPEFLEAMLVAVDLLEKVSTGELTLSKARAIFEEKVNPVIAHIRETSRPVRGKSKTKKSKKKSSKKTKTKKESKTKSKKSKSKKSK